MASLPPYKIFLSEDFPGSPSWFGKFLASLNVYTLAVYNALNGNLNVFTNLAEARVTITVTGGSSATSWTGPTSFTNPLGVTPKDLWITKVTVVNPAVYTPNTATIGPIDWTGGPTTITLNAIPGLVNGTQYTLQMRMAS